MSEQRVVRVGLLGCGTVGSGVLKLLSNNAQSLAERVGAPLRIERVLVRDLERSRGEQCRQDWLTTDPGDVVDNPNVDVVVEVMGGESPTFELLSRALSAGKSVVTANKLLLAARGTELLKIAAKNSADLAFEAAVGGGIPVVRTLREALVGDEVLSLHGILNGTCNYVLTRMKAEGLAFEDVLADAQRLGYAEAEPSMDVDGHDAAQKLAILVALSFGASVDLKDVSVEGIRSVDTVDFRLAERFGFNIKHLAIARRRGALLELRVHPAMVPISSVLGNINDVLNGVYIRGKALGPCLLVGRGAGELPTAVSIVGDLVDVARAQVAGVPGFTTKQIQPQAQAIVPADDVETRYYLRFDVQDGPGVLGRIASALGEQGVSVEQMVQEGRGGDAVPILILSHQCREGAIRAAMRSVAGESFMKRPPRFMRIENI